MKIVLAGGSGSLGRRLCANLVARGHDVVVLTRRPGRASYREVGWDGRTVGSWADELKGAVVINLAGELVDRRPTAANISLLTSSRVDPTRALVAASGRLAEPVPLWVQASTMAIYGDAGEGVLDERSSPADGPPQMAGVARAWEAALDGANAERIVVLRTSIVLDAGAPALERLAGLARWGVGGRVGDGRQWFSWIHIDDWLALVRALLPGEPLDSLTGVIHATSPQPTRNAELMAALRRAVGRPWAPPTPAPLVRLGALVLRTDPALALTGRRAVPRRLTEAGFGFAHPSMEGALADLLRGR